MWSKVSCLRKQHDGRDWASNHRPSDLKSNALTTKPLRPLHRMLTGSSEIRGSEEVHACRTVSVLRGRLNRRAKRTSAWEATYRIDVGNSCLLLYNFS